MSSSGIPSRLADYFVILDLDQDQIKYESSVGTISQRFPEVDWPDIPFSYSLQTFCQPQGWNLSAEPQLSSYFVCTLTDIMGAHQYACCLQKYEECHFEAEDSSEPRIVYKPKVYVILSRHAFFDFFKSCLRRVSDAHATGNPEASIMVATLLSGVNLRVGESVSFTLSGERLSVRAPTFPTMPISGGTVAVFARQLGNVYNLLLILRAVLSEQKIVLVSSSFTLLSQVAHAIRTLLYPFEYSYTYVPVLPQVLLEYLESPTPYLMGVLRPSDKCIPRSDAIVVDLDIGHVAVPESIQVPVIPEPFNSQLTASLQTVLNPGLQYVDHTDPPPLPPKPSNERLDTQIRACFIRFFADILDGYRTCLELVRIFPTPLIVFHTSAFVGIRNLNPLQDYALIHQLYKSHMFQMFITSRGVPYRSCDIFDYVVYCNHEAVVDERTNAKKLDENIKKLAKMLQDNESQEATFPAAPSTWSNGTEHRSNQFSSKPLNAERIAATIESNVKADETRFLELPAPKEVPMEDAAVSDDECHETRTRRLQVLEECMSAILENRIAEARKLLPAVEFSLRTKSARVHLCSLLCAGMQPVHRATLHPQQFDIVVKLINCALEQETVEDQHGIAYACLYFSYVYCRRLSHSVQQYAYTCIQDHDVWENERFWEAAFFHDVHRLMRRHYLSGDYRNEEQEGNLFSVKGTADTWNLYEKPSAMHLAAQLIKDKENMTEEEIERYSKEEESIIFGQAKHYINLMIYLRIPLEKVKNITKEITKFRDKGKETESMDESDRESGFIDVKFDPNDTELVYKVTRWITRVIDRICSSAGLSPRLMEQLSSLIGPCVGIHVDTLEQVYSESKKIAPPPKAAIALPELYKNESITDGQIRAFLLPDDKQSGNTLDDAEILPAEGMVFITNYRIIFKGNPVNPLLCDSSVIRSIPILSLTKDKTFATPPNAQMENIPAKVVSGINGCLSFRSSTFQTMTIICDEEENQKKLERLWSQLSARRWPPMLPHMLFCYHECANLVIGPSLTQDKSKYNTMRNFGKKTFMSIQKNLPKKGTLTGSISRKTKMLESPSRTLGSTGNAMEDYLDMTELVGPSSDKVNYDLHRRAIIDDFHRLRFYSENSLFRVTNVNGTYDITKSYPGLLVVPSAVSDEALIKVSKGFRNSRFPVITWISQHGALLIRGAGIMNETVVDKIKKQAKELGNQQDGMHDSKQSLATVDSGTLAPPTPSTSSAYQEHYLTKLASSSPTSSTAMFCGSMPSLISSTFSVDSSDGASIKPSEVAKKASANRSETFQLFQFSTTEFTRHAANFIRSSGSRSTTKATPPRRPLKSSDTDKMEVTNGSKTEIRAQSLQRRSLYIFGEKSYSKAYRLDKSVDFIPVVYPTTHQMKSSFKKILKLMNPSYANSDNVAKSFHRLLEESRWLNIVGQLLQLSSCMAAIMVKNNSSVALCIEDGWDTTCQLTSLVQILLDPYYRTIEGFKVLICKEWLSFGHRFSHRQNHTEDTQSGGIAPVFMLFLDAVYQLIEQYPHAFEFNDFFLRFLNYHSQAAFFRNFIFDSEQERATIESLAPSPSGEHDIWTYIDKTDNARPLFTNFLYDPNLTPTLDPRTCVAALNLWKYYSEEFPAHGCPYDIEVAERELNNRMEEQLKKNESKTTRQNADHRVPVDLTRECEDLTVNDAFKNQFARLKAMSPLIPSDSQEKNWKGIMNDLVAEEYNQHEDVLSVNEWDQYVEQSVTKRAVMKHLLKGTNQIAPSTSRQHQFEAYTSTVMETCSVCKSALSGTVVRHGIRCKACRIVAHDKCGQFAIACGSTGLSSPRAASHNALSIKAPKANLNRHSLIIPDSPDKAALPRLDNIFEADSGMMPTDSPRPSHTGYLFKKGATFRLFKSRYFALDGNKCKLRYYDSESDTFCRGEIDLCDLESIDIVFPVPSVPRKGSAMIEIRTKRRSYSLMANTKAEADQWKEKIENALRQ